MTNRRCTARPTPNPGGPRRPASARRRCPPGLTVLIAIAVGTSACGPARAPGGRVRSTAATPAAGPSAFTSTTAFSSASTSRALERATSSTSGPPPAACPCAPRRSIWCRRSDWNRPHAPERRRGTVKNGSRRRLRNSEYITMSSWRGTKRLRAARPPEPFQITVITATALDIHRYIYSAWFDATTSTCCRATHLQLAFQRPVIESVVDLKPKLRLRITRQALCQFACECLIPLKRIDKLLQFFQ